MDIQQQMLDFIQNGDLDGIHQLLEKFKLEAEPDVQYQVADVFMNLGFIEEADEVLAHLQYLFPEEVQLKIDRAGLLLEIGQEDQALDLFMSVPHDAPEYPQVLLALADYYQMQGLYEVAEKQLNDAIDLLPNENLLKFAKAELLLEMGRFTESSRLYEIVYKDQQEMAGIRIVERLAEVYRSAGAYEDALHHYKHALEDNTSPDLLFGAAYAAYQSEMYDEAIRYGGDLVELDPDYFSGYLLLAQSYAMQENNKKALEIIKSGIKRDEYDKELYLFAGKMAIKNSLPEEAEQFLRQAIALDPEYMEAVVTLVSLLSHDERDEEMIELVESLDKNDYDWSTLSMFIAPAYDRLEQFEEAYKHYQIAYREHSEDAQLLEKYAYFLIEDGKRDEAKKVVAALNVLQPDEPEWIDLLQTFEA